MPPEQEHIFVQTAQMGMACGLEHPIEWCMNAISHNSWMPYEDTRKYEDTVIEAFLAFYRGCASSPEDPWVKMDSKMFADMVDKHYGYDGSTNDRDNWWRCP